MIDDNHPSETSESSEEESITDLQDDTFYNVNESLLVEMDQAELTAINNKIKNRKAFLTKYERQLTDLQDFIQRDPDSGTNLYLAADVKKAIVGTNIGGWQVLEPWITPSLVYRFLGKTHSEGVGMDQYTFCEALGPEEGNAVLREHWDKWIT